MMHNNKTKLICTLVSLAMSSSLFAGEMTLEQALAKHRAKQGQVASSGQGNSLNSTMSSRTVTSSQALQPMSAPAQEQQTALTSNEANIGKLAPGYTPILSKIGDVVYLNDTERLLIESKKDAILKYLHEQEELGNARKALEKAKRTQALEKALKDEFNLTPEEIKIIREKRLEISKAQNTPVTDVQLNIRTIDIDVDAPKPITLAVKNGYASSLIFYDQAGEPWPIEGDIVGDPTNFNKQTTTENKNIAVFDIINDFNQSNALIHLVGLNLPIVLKLVGTSDEVDARLSVRLPRLGPNSQQLIGTGGKEKVSSLSPMLMKILNGDKLVGGSLYEVKGAEKTTATVKDGKMYIRTTASLLSPPPLNSAKSPTGYSAYEIYPVTNLLFSQDGELKNATVEKGFTVEIKHKTTVFN